MKKIFPFFSLLLFTFLSFSQIKLPRLISNGIIFQRNQDLKIWGWASPLEHIIVSLGNERIETKADEKGNWKVNLKSRSAGGPYILSLKGKNEIDIKDIYFGDVFLCSGQSNMQLWMGRLKYIYPKEVESANYPLIRQFKVPNEYSFLGPNVDFSEGIWTPVNSKTIPDFSGVAYFFAKELFQKYQVPIGIINSSLGGSPIESWISEASLKPFPNAYQELNQFKNEKLIQEIELHNQTQNKLWYQFTSAFDIGNDKRFVKAQFEDNKWANTLVPGRIDSKSPFGVYWLRKKVIVPASMVGKNALLELGRIADADSVFVNGELVGTTSYQYPPRRYPLGSSILKSGENTIAIRLISSGTSPELIAGKRYELTTISDTVSLAGSWKYFQSVTSNAIPSQTTVRWKPTGLYNAMIAPLQNLSIKAVLWYQGESNVNNANQYGDLLKSMVLDWRNTFNRPNLPFIIAQLPNYLPSTIELKESAWATLRQQQLSILTLPFTCVSNNIDLGDWNDIHPENKLDVAKRLARIAYPLVYGETVADATGPICSKAENKGNYILLTFSNAQNGLQIFDNRVVKNFAIAGNDKKFIWASADIQGNKIRVWNSLPTEVKFVRYAWADNPMPVNVYNQIGLPAFPFEIEVH
jgi:sialate O-acetylesterase